MDGIVKKENIETATRASSSSSESSDSDDGDDNGGNGRNGSGNGVVLGRRVRVSNGGGGVAMTTKKKKRRVDELRGVIVPAGFLQQLPPPVMTAAVTTTAAAEVPVAQSILAWITSGFILNFYIPMQPVISGLSEVCNGATYVNIDMLVSKKDGSRMLLIEDNGGGMDPDKMRQCMSLGYSAKSKLANTIGQYGNGFKTSTMRLGADVIVFSRCCGKDGKSPTQSIGLLSYTFLRSTKKEDIVVPMLDYEGKEQEWNKIIRSSPGDWSKNLETIVQWSPFSSEVDLLRQFNLMRAHGTRIIIYNLWEDDQGQLELDFDADPHDIQIRGVNRDEKNIQMAKEYPNSKHFLTYRHSLRVLLASNNSPWERCGAPQYSVLEANFVEPAHDKQGFERTTVLARLESRLIQMQKNYWFVFLASHLTITSFTCKADIFLGTNCHRIGYAARRNKKFLASADSETSLDSLPPPSQSKKKNTASSSKTPFSNLEKYSSRLNQRYGRKESENFQEYGDGHLSSKGKNRVNTPTKSGKRHNFSEPSSPSAEIESDNDVHIDLPEKQSNGSGHKAFPGIKSFGKSALHTNRASSIMDDAESQQDCASGGITVRPSMQSHSKVGDVNCSAPSLSEPDLRTVEQLKEENQELRKRFEKREGEVLGELLHDLLSERDKCKSLEAQVSFDLAFSCLGLDQLLASQQKIDDLTKEQESLIDIFAEERDRRRMRS
ncbi:protein microrchidia 7 [Quercus suber]|uniref:Protein microrchidia 7 n=1 Tax=Quercus suber TaxID=58331 RepID=A0AAW0LCV8_QUESU